MRILLLNDTSTADNIGCRITSQGLTNLLTSNGAVQIERVSSKYKPAGFDDFASGLSLCPLTWGEKLRTSWNQFIQNLPPGLSRWIRKIQDSSPVVDACLWISNRFPHLAPLFNATRNFKLDFKFDIWMKWVHSLVIQDPEIIRKIDQSDVVILNGEGTLHHDHRNVLSLMALLKLAQLRNKPTAVVNATLQALHPQFLEQVIKKSTKVVVRDRASFSYLQKEGVPCDLGADCAFYSDFRAGLEGSDLPRLDPKQKNCFITAGARGVLNRSKIIYKIIMWAKKRGYSVYYLSLTSADTKLANYLQNAGVPGITFPPDAWPYIIPFLKQAHLIVSGRHHINIFSILAKVPFIPLSSNTWKIHGTCELLRWPVPVVETQLEFRKVLEKLPHYLSSKEDIYERAVQIGRNRAMFNISILKAKTTCEKNNL